MVPPPEDPVVSRALEEGPEQRYVGDRDLTAWPTAVGSVLVRLAAELRQRLTPQAVLLVVLAVGLVLAAGLTALAGAVYDAVTEDDGVAALDRPLLDAVLGLRTPALDTAVTAFSALGGPVGMPVLAGVVAIGLAVAWRQWTPVLLVAATAAGSLALTVVGKVTVGRVRPPQVDAVPPYEVSASFPSGHSLNAIALAGIVAYLLVRRQRTRRARTATVVAAAVFALLMGASRVYLGHHWLTDVLVAWALGL
ncbi:phosphatase PAP2 family protein, partial [Pseudonocardia abyssalis]